MIEIEPEDDRRMIFIHTDHSPDEIRNFYEIPDAITRRLQPTGDRRTFTQCLADMLDLTGMS